MNITKTAMVGIYKCAVLTVTETEDQKQLYTQFLMQCC